MATNDVRINLAPLPVAFPSFAALHGIGNSNIWQSGAVVDAEPHHDQVMISFSLIGDGAVAAEDQVNFYWANSDEGAIAIWDAGIAPGESSITVLTEISDIEDVCDLVFSVRIDRINQAIKGSFIVFSPGPTWQLLIQVVTANPAAGLAGANNEVRYRFGTPQIQP